jgi:U11/U12 small nuclear ribonucleoprotein SNRNP25
MSDTLQEQQLAEELQKQIKQLLDDEILKDLGTFPTEEEVDTLIAVEQGQAYQITLNRDPLPPVRKYRVF